MRVHIRSVFLPSLAIVAFASACSSSDESKTGKSGNLPCAVDAVLAADCQSCHAAEPKFGAPMPLVTYADLTAPAVSDASKKVYELVGTRTHDDARPMPQPPASRLDATSQKTLDDWIAAGAPSSDDATCGAGGGGQGGGGSNAGGGGESGGCTPDTPIIPAASWTMPKETDDIYICYGVDVTVAQKKQVVGMLPRVDNTKIVHHIVLFQSDSEVAPGPTPCGLSGAADWRIVSVWTPGSEGFVLPPEAGIPLEGTAHYVVQVHYNNLAHLEGESDHSGFDLCTTTDLRPNEADVLGFGSVKFTIPAHGSLDMTCSYPIPDELAGAHVIGATPHMHTLGTLISTVAMPGSLDLGRRDPWSFTSQYWSPIDATLPKGGVVETRCAWSNPGSKPVHWGEYTEDEMCWSFTMYYPKINASDWSWAKPSEVADCQPTP